MNKSLFFLEWKQIFTNKKLLVPIAAILFIPILYAGMFIWAFWDPYAQMADLPVAVVNEDTGAKFEGEHLSLGDELVENLKEQDAFQFHFVEKETAYRDLEKQKYYMVIEIPHDFSSNATTLMDEHPEKLTLKYVPNETYNFLSAQIGETAIKEIKAAVSSEVTSTYAETIFSKIGEMADGYETANNGAGQLEDGSKKLKDGSVDLKENLELLASKSLEFENGVTKVNSGTGDLANGTNELAGGLNQLTNGSSQLVEAANEVKSGATKIAGGLAEANNGLQQMESQLPELVAGTDELKNGVTEFQEKLPSQLASAIGSQLTTSVAQMTNGLDSVRDQVSPQVASSIANQIISKQTESMTQLASSLAANGMDQQTISMIIEQVQSSSPSKEDLAATLEQAIDAGLSQGFAAYKEQVTSQFSDVPSTLESQIKTAVNPTFNELTKGITSIHDGQAAVLDGVSRLTNGTGELTSGATQLVAGQQTFIDNIELFSDKLSEAANGANQLATGSTELNSGVTELANSAGKITDGTNQLADGSSQIATGADELAGGTKELHEKLGEAATQARAVESDDDTYAMIGEPVTVEKESVNSVENYGTGFAPYFLSLGLFVGALLITIVYPIKEPVSKPKNSFTWFASKFGVIAIVGSIQALLADIILLSWVGIDVQSIPLFIIVSLITSITFMTMIQFLVTTLADAGRFVAIIILILQLTTSAGTFPLELIPAALQPINALLPMSYTVQAFKAVISSGDFSFVWHNVGIIASYMVGAMALTIAFFSVKIKKSNRLGEQVKEVA